MHESAGRAGSQQSGDGAEGPTRVPVVPSAAGGNTGGGA